MGEMLIRILAEGKKIYRTNFKNVETDLTEEEKSLQNGEDIFSYKAIKSLNSAELFNKSIREKNKPVGYDFDEFNSTYRTRDFKFYSLRHMADVCSYLLGVNKFAKFISLTVKEIYTKSGAIQTEKGYKKTTASYRKAKFVVTGLVDLLGEIRTMKDDFTSQSFCHYLEKSYSILDSDCRKLFMTSVIPDEIAQPVESLYQGIRLKKISNEVNKESDEIMAARFSMLGERLYNCIHMFLLRVLEEFFPYITPPTFLNNPKGETLFIVPLSLYKKFNFQNSGLYISETVFLKSDDKLKTAKKQIDFFE